jgi:hypothetical protein
MANTLTLGVQEYKTPTISSCQAVPAKLSYGDSAKLNASTTGSACSTIMFKWIEKSLTARVHSGVV